MFEFWPFSRPAEPQPSDDYDPTAENDCDLLTSEPATDRVLFGRPNTVVYGYPSSGGFLILPYCNGVDLAFLGVPRFEVSQRSHDPEVEDGHCQRMKMLGAWRFGSRQEYIRIAWENPERLHQMTVVVAAWPQNGTGVWVAKTTGRKAVGEGFAWVWNALRMDERCEVASKLGGKFYENPATCPDLEL
ncbi:hypothetical protein F4859DRAFT_466186 [Xylaria cf. heliscus]|nr:hypothetical protein F4859DRAFT_466186 [Xylaria cf. heliscus]